MALSAGKRDDLRADNGSRTMHFAEVRQGQLYGSHLSEEEQRKRGEKGGPMDNMIVKGSCRVYMKKVREGCTYNEIHGREDHNVSRSSIGSNTQFRPS